MQTYYDNLFLERMKEKLVLNNWADQKRVPLWKGKTVDYFAYYPIASDSTAITEGSSTANEVTISGQTIQATVAKWAQWAPHTEIVKLTARDENLKGQVELFGNAAAESLEKALALQLFQRGSIPIRVDQLDNSSTFTFESTVDASATTNTSTVFVDAAIPAASDADSFWVGAHWAATYLAAGDGTTAANNYRHGALVVDSASAAQTVTLTTAHAAPTSFTAGCHYRMVSGSGLAAANIITGTAVEYAVSKARENKFYTFPGGFFHASLAPQIEYDLNKNTVFRNIGQYQQASRLDMWEIGKLWGVKWYRATIPFREDVDGTANFATGVVFCTPIMGMHSLGNVHLGGQPGGQKPRIMIKTPGNQTTSEPIDERGTVGYKFYAAPKSLNAAFCINLMSGATGVV
jgi:N4-gp56 family major capsid protein